MGNNDEYDSNEYDDGYDNEYYYHDNAIINSNRINNSKTACVTWADDGTMVVTGSFDGSITCSIINKKVATQEAKNRIDDDDCNDDGDDDNEISLVSGERQLQHQHQHQHQHQYQYQYQYQRRKNWFNKTVNVFKKKMNQNEITMKERMNLMEEKMKKMIIVQSGDDENITNKNKELAAIKVEKEETIKATTSTDEIVTTPSFLESMKQMEERIQIICQKQEGQIVLFDEQQQQHNLRMDELEKRIERVEHNVHDQFDIFNKQMNRLLTHVEEQSDVNNKLEERMNATLLSVREEGSMEQKKRERIVEEKMMAMENKMR